MKVKAPKGHHWMKQPKGGFKLMKHTGKFVKHKGASLEANFPIQKHPQEILSKALSIRYNSLFKPLP